MRHQALPPLAQTHILGTVMSRYAYLRHINLGIGEFILSRSVILGVLSREVS